MSSEFAGRKYIVTGASSGIGKETALYFHARGATVSLLARRQDVLEQIVAEECKGERAFAFAVDVTNDQELTNAVTKSIEAMGGLDGLVNNAGGLGCSIEAVTANPFSIGNFDGSFALNTRSAIVATNAALPTLIESKGTVVNVSSVAGLRPDVGMPFYCTAKAALDMVTKNYALAFAAKGVRFNSINPAVIDTPIFTAVGMSSEQVQAGLGPIHPVGRVGRTDEVAALIAFLSSPSIGFVTGTNVPIDGGYTLTVNIGNKKSLLE